MNAHLSVEQIDACLVGEANLETDRHLNECAHCRAELARVQQTFGSFRDSVHHVAVSPQTWTVKATRSPLPLSRLSLAFAAIALCIFLVFSLHRKPAVKAVDDDALLSQIDAEVSRTVPGPMEPLTKFLSN